MATEEALELARWMKYGAGKERYAHTANPLFKLLEKHEAEQTAREAAAHEAAKYKGWVTVEKPNGGIYRYNPNHDWTRDETVLSVNDDAPPASGKDDDAPADGQDDDAPSDGQDDDAPSDDAPSDGKDDGKDDDGKDDDDRDDDFDDFMACRNCSPISIVVHTKR